MAIGQNLLDDAQKQRLLELRQKFDEFKKPGPYLQPGHAYDSHEIKARFGEEEWIEFVNLRARSAGIEG